MLISNFFLGGRVFLPVGLNYLEKSWQHVRFEFIGCGRCGDDLQVDADP
jgi:hypothetical protein